MRRYVRHISYTFVFYCLLHTSLLSTSFYRHSAYDADIYSCGVTLFCFLHGKLPYCESTYELFPERLYRRILAADYKTSDTLDAKSLSALHYLLSHPSDRHTNHSGREHSRTRTIERLMESLTEPYVFSPSRPS